MSRIGSRVCSAADLDVSMTKLALKEKEANDDTTSLSVDGASESESDIVKEKVGESYEICERLFFTFFSFFFSALSLSILQSSKK